MHYFYVKDYGMICKGEGDLPFSRDRYIYDKDRGWVYDEWAIVSDFLMGYDSCEDDPIYRCGNFEIMDRIEEISEKEAKKILKNNYKFKLGNNPRKWNP